ncbi:MAG TPA: deoxyribonuclease IV [Patescibacteria group bacterium]|jgi:deoxyribonuclease-4|nr:deoxyribonuclease IV [Patescibacteria group bacterium]
MSIKKLPLLLGAHISIKGGFDKAIKGGASIGCNAIQFFTKSNRQWHARKITKEDIDLLDQAIEETNIERKHIFVHSSYLINLAAGNKIIAKQSYRALQEELERCTLLKIPYLILHPGSATGLTAQEGILQIINLLEEILRFTSSSTMILLENMAGQGNVVGKTFTEIASIINGLSSEAQEKIGVCIDTCHLFASGIAFDTEEVYQKTWKTFDTLIGCDKIKLFHLNDSKNEYNSHLDRHEHITKGKIPIKSFKLLLHDKQFENIPKILETPHTHLVDHALNIKTVLDLYNDKF